MILKKPYAFLIKYFKLIHIILSGFVFYIVIRFNNISQFFVEYVKRGAGGTSLVLSRYVDFYLYISLFIIIVFSIFMLLLMRKKEKPTLLYALLGVYYIVLFISVISANMTINSLNEITLTQQSARAYRDIYMIISLPQYYFLLMSIIRAIGFDVKKFNFTKDLEELEIKSEDNEEFEFVLGTDSYKYKRKFRRTLREINYYFKENKVIISIIFGTIILFGITYSFINFGILDKKYKVGSTGTIGSFRYNLISAYETEFDYNGNIIKKDKKYIVLKMNITNLSYKAQKFNNTSFYLAYDEYSAYHEPSLKDYFQDIGKVYLNENIIPEVSNELIFVFEIPKNLNNNQYYLNILKDITYDKGVEKYNYEKFDIRPYRYIQQLETKKINIDDEILLGDNHFLDSKMVIKEVNLMGNYQFKYEHCKENDCKEYIDVVSPTDPIRNNLLVVNYELDINEESGFVKTMINYKHFFDTFIKIEYNSKNTNYTRKVNTKTLPSLENLLFIDIPKSITSTDSLKLIVETRENRYSLDITS